MIHTCYKCRNCGSYKYDEVRGVTHRCRDCGSVTLDGRKVIDVPYPKCTIFGKEVETSVPFENFYDKDTGYDYGVNVVIVFRDVSHYRNENGYVYNVTEIHNLYKPLARGSESIAFESDIHLHGWTVGLSHIESMTVTVADKVEVGMYQKGDAS